MGHSLGKRLSNLSTDSNEVPQLSDCRREYELFLGRSPLAIHDEKNRHPSSQSSEHSLMRTARFANRSKLPRNHGQIHNRPLPKERTIVAGWHRSSSGSSSRLLDAIAVRHEPTRKCKTCCNVLGLQHRILAKNLLVRFAGAEISKDALDRYAQVSDHRLAIAYIRINRDSVSRNIHNQPSGVRARPVALLQNLCRGRASGNLPT